MQVISSYPNFYRVQVLEMGRWSGRKAAGKKNKGCSGKAEEGKLWSKVWRHGEPMFAPKVC